MRCPARMWGLMVGKKPKKQLLALNYLILSTSKNTVISECSDSVHSLIERAGSMPEIMDDLLVGWWIEFYPDSASLQEAQPLQKQPLRRPRPSPGVRPEFSAETPRAGLWNPTSQPTTQGCEVLNQGRQVASSPSGNVTQCSYVF